MVNRYQNSVRRPSKYSCVSQQEPSLNNNNRYQPTIISTINIITIILTIIDIHTIIINHHQQQHNEETSVNQPKPSNCQLCQPTISSIFINQPCYLHPQPSSPGWSKALAPRSRPLRIRLPRAGRAPLGGLGGFLQLLGTTLGLPGEVRHWKIWVPIVYQ